MTDERIMCPYCKMPAEWVSNEAVYGQPYGTSHMIYLCRDCNAYVGCHRNTLTPLGTMANAELRQWRRKAHDHIDPLWQSGQMNRSEVYKWLRHELGREIHIGESDIETCKRIIELRREGK